MSRIVTPLTLAALFVAVSVVNCQQVNAATLTDDDIAFCGVMADTAKVVVDTRGEGMNKQDMYRYVLPELEEPARNTTRVVIDLVFKGHTPDDIFDSCVRVTLKQKEGDLKKPSEEPSSRPAVKKNT